MVFFLFFCAKQSGFCFFEFYGMIETLIKRRDVLYGEVSDS